MTRPSWDEYFMEIARIVATRATCPRAAVGSVIVSNKKIISTGYNGSPSNTKHCYEIGCFMFENHCIRTIHSEANALLYAKQDLSNATIYTTYQPCINCSKLIMGAGITKIIYKHQYWDKTGEQLFLECNYIQREIMEGENIYQIYEKIYTNF
jgi:dCMP deaminase